MDGGAFEPGFAAIGGSHQEHTARPGYRAAGLHPNLDQGNGPPSVCSPYGDAVAGRSEEHTSELQSLRHLVCRLLLEKKKRCWAGTWSLLAFSTKGRSWPTLSS